jgi:hypothetical protein
MRALRPEQKKKTASARRSQRWPAARGPAKDAEYSSVNSSIHVVGASTGVHVELAADAVDLPLEIPVLEF